MFKIISRIKLTYRFSESVLITSPTGFDTAFTIVEAKLEQSCINVVQRWKSDVEFCFIFNVRSTLFQRWSTTLKQCWSNVEMLAGLLFQDSYFFRTAAFFLFFRTVTFSQELFFQNSFLFGVKLVQSRHFLRIRNSLQNCLG